MFIICMYHFWGDEFNDKAIKEIGLSQKPARIGMITARQRVGLCAGPKN